MIITPCPPWWSLCLHGLALIPAPEPANLYDARYEAWCRQTLPQEAWKPFIEDRAALTHLIARAGTTGWGLNVLPLLHATVDDFLADASRSISALAPSRIADLGAHRTLVALAAQHEALVELVRANLALVAGAFVYDTAEVAPCNALDTWCSLAARVLPSFGRRKVVMARALGARGRALGGILATGIVGGWSERTAPQVVIVALHEHAVLTATEVLATRRAEYREVERVALVALAATLEGSELEDHYRAWRATIDVSSLLNTTLSVEELAAVREVRTRLRMA